MFPVTLKSNFMNIKFSKFDIGSIQRRPGAVKRPWVFKHEPIRIAPKPGINPIWAQGSFAGAALVMILVLGIAGYLSKAHDASKEILGSATSAYSQLQGAGEDLTNQNFTAARGLFVSAQNNIRLAQEKLGAFGALKFFTPQAKSADHMLSGASLLAQAGTKLSEALSLFEEIKVTSNGI